MSETSPRTGTEPAGDEIGKILCAWEGCRLPFVPRFPGQKFHAPKCKAAYAREIGLVATLSGARRLKGKHSITFHTTDDRALDAPLGTRFRLVREPE